MPAQPEDPAPPSAESATLLAALTTQNEQLRARNGELTERLAQMQAAQAELDRHLRLTAPLRLVQERVRLARTRRRRRRVGAVPPQPDGAARRSLMAASERQLAAHPLLRRTTELVAGGELGGVPADLRAPVCGRGDRIAVVAHVYYEALWPELAERISRIPVPVDLVVTLVEGRSEVLGDRIVAEFPDVTLVVTPNRGRDMWPFTRALATGLVGDHAAVLKLHTKASVHRLDGAAWRRRLLDSLCPSPDRIGLMLDLLARDPRVGMIAPAGAVLGSEFWGANGPLIDALAVRTGIAVDPARTWFAGGSMFWARPEPLLRLRDAALTIDDFEHEAVSIDGTTAHALERFLGALVGAAGQEVIDANTVPGRLASALSSEARRSATES